METLQTPPSRSDFTPLNEHQSQTPASFYDGPAILYHRSSSCTLRISTRDLEVATAFNGLASGAKTIDNGQVNGHSGGGESLNGEDNDAEEVGGNAEVEISSVEVWITSEYIFPFLSRSCHPSWRSQLNLPLSLCV